jgi:hypothetical protein
VGAAGYYAPSSWAYYSGPFTFQSKVKLQTIQDGTSNTLLFIEIVGGRIDWNGSGGIPNGISGWSLVAGFNYAGFGTLSQQGSKGSEWYLHGSNHAMNQTMVCYADGSVRHLNKSIDWMVWLYLNAMNDGVVVSIED